MVNDKKMQSAGSNFKEKIIAVRRGAMGDTLLFLPVLAALRRAWPEEKILFAGNGDYLSLVRKSGLADRAISVEGWPPLRDIYRQGGASGDCPEEWQGCRLVLLEWESGGQWGPIRLYDPRPKVGLGEPIGCQLLRRAGLSGDFDWPTPALPGLTLPRGNRVVMHLGAGSRRKMWPAEKFYALAGEIEKGGRAVTILAGPVEADRGLVEALRERGLAVALAGALDELLAHLAGAALFVGNDSGPTHLANACSIPTIAIFGPTDPAVWAPPWPDCRVVHHGEDLAGLAVSEVLAPIRDRLGF